MYIYVYIYIIYIHVVNNNTIINLIKSHLDPVAGGIYTCISCALTVTIQCVCTCIYIFVNTKICSIYDYGNNIQVLSYISPFLQLKCQSLVFFIK